MPESNLRLSKSYCLLWAQALEFFEGPPNNYNVQPELRNSYLVQLLTLCVGERGDSQDRKEPNLESPGQS